MNELIKIGNTVYFDKSKFHKSFQNIPEDKGRIVREVKVQRDYGIELIWDVCIDEIEDARLLVSKDAVSLNPFSNCDTISTESHSDQVIDIMNKEMSLVEFADKYVNDNIESSDDMHDLSKWTGIKEFAIQCYMAGYKSNPNKYTQEEFEYHLLNAFESIMGSNGFEESVKYYIKNNKK